MAKRKKTKLKRWWIVSLVVAVVLFAFYNFTNSKVPSSQQPPAGYLLYQDSTNGFSIEYPEAWEIRKDTQVFENGDAVAFRISGTTQKENTELTDGAQVAISKPFSIGKDLETWAREYYDRYAEHSKRSLNGRSFEKVDYCSRIGCLTYYYTLKNDKVYGVGVFAQGADKMVYDNTVVYMLKSLQLNSESGGISSKEDSVSKVKLLPEVIDYLKRVPGGLVAVNGEENNSYLVQVYEVTNGHTATFNWYSVNKTTGQVKKE